MQNDDDDHGRDHFLHNRWLDSDAQWGDADQWDGELPEEKYTQGKFRSALNMAQKSKDGKGNVKLKMIVVWGMKGVDPATNPPQRTTTVPGSLVTLKDDMKTATGKLQQVAYDINAKQADYRLQTTNSNAAAGTAYGRVTGQAPSVSEKVPGSNLNVLTGKDLAPLPTPQPFIYTR